MVSGVPTLTLSVKVPDVVTISPTSVTMNDTVYLVTSISVGTVVTSATVRSRRPSILGRTSSPGVVVHQLYHNEGRQKTGTGNSVELRKCRATLKTILDEDLVLDTLPVRRPVVLENYSRVVK